MTAVHRCDALLIQAFSGGLICDDAHGGVAGDSDWRVRTIADLKTIRLEPGPGCSKSPCIDPIFGPTAADGPSKTGNYWSSSSSHVKIAAMLVAFQNGAVGGGTKADVAKIFACIDCEPSHRSTTYLHGRQRK